MIKERVCRKCGASNKDKEFILDRNVCVECRREEWNFNRYKKFKPRDLMYHYNITQATYKSAGGGHMPIVDHSKQVQTPVRIK